MDGDITITNNTIKGPADFSGLTAFDSELELKDNDFEDLSMGIYLANKGDIDENELVIQDNDFDLDEFVLEDSWLEEADTGGNLPNTNRLYVMTPDEENVDLENIEGENDFDTDTEIYEYWYEIENHSEGEILGNKVEK